MSDVLCEIRFDDGLHIQVVSTAPSDERAWGSVELRYRNTAEGDWEMGDGRLDWPVDRWIRVGMPAWAFDAEVLGDTDRLVFFGVAEPGCGCSVELDGVTIALTGPALIVAERTNTRLLFHSPLGDSTIAPRLPEGGRARVDVP